MALAVGSLANVGYVQEESFGVTPPSPALKVFRRVQNSINLTKEAYESEEIRSDRMTADLRHGVRRVQGDVETELSVGSFDDFFQAGLGGTWAAGVSATEADFTSITSNGGAKTFTIAGGSWITKGFRIGDVIQFSNLAATGNNGKNFTITNITALTITVAETVVTDAVADTAFTVQVMGYKVKMGNTYRSFTIERGYTDISQYQVFKGCRLNTIGLNLPPTGITRATFGFMGQDQDALSSTSLDPSYSTVSTNSPLASINGVLREGGTTLAVVTGLTLNINNNLGGKPVIGQDVIPDMLWGNRAQITGQLTILFEDATLFNKFVNESESTLEVRLDDPNGTDFLHFFLPRIKYSSADIGDADPQGLPITMNFTALKPTNTTNYDDSAIIIQRSNS